MVALIALAQPAFNALQDRQSILRAASDIKGMLDNARSCAIASNTYVYVGIAEADSSLSSSASPQAAATATRGGRVAVGVVASRDGTKHYAISTTSQGADWQASYGTGGWFAQIGKVRYFENVHLAILNGAGASIPSSGGMNRPVILSDSYVLGGVDSSRNTQTPFSLPLGSRLTSGYQYRFDKVIQFNPQGVARLVLSTNSDGIDAYIEIGLQSTHGNTVPSSPSDQTTGKIAAIQVDCLTGKARVFLP